MWLLNNATAVNINPANYNLPKEMKGFTTLTKRKDIDKNEGFIRFIKHLINSEAPGITTLKNWLVLFNQNKLGILNN